MRFGRSGNRAALAGAALLFAAVCLSQTTGQIRGKATDGEGNALAGVKVEAASGRSGKRETTTDSGGRFGFPGLAPGSYAVTFHLESYGSVEKKAAVRLDGTAFVNAKLFRISN